MASVSTYLNFPRNTEAAFAFYRSVFGADYATPIMRFGDVPPQPGCAPTADADKNLVMHVALPILGGHLLMGTDASESMGTKLNAGNNVYINLSPDTRAETERLFNALAEGGAAAGHVLGRLLRQLDRRLRHPVDVQLRREGGLRGAIIMRKIFVINGMTHQSVMPFPGACQ